MNLTLQTTTSNDAESQQTNKHYVKVKSLELSRIYYIRSEVADRFDHPLENLSEIKLMFFSDYVVNTDTNRLEKCRVSMVELLDNFLIIEDRLEKCRVSMVELLDNFLIIEDL